MSTAKPKLERLSRREREIMDVFYRLGTATANEVHFELDAPPSETTVRKLIRILEAKGHLSHKTRGREYLYAPTLPKAHARRKALSRLVSTFFNGSPVDAAAALLRDSKTRLTPDDVTRLFELIDEAAREGR